MELWGIIGVIITLFALIFGYVDSNNDFSTSVDSMRVDIDQGGIAQISAEVHPESFYDEDIILRAKSVPSYIHVDFEPEILEPENNSVSTVTISAEKKAPPGEYWIPIVSIGSDGNEHVLEFKLNVRSTSTPKSTPTPTQSEGSISVYSSPFGASIYLDDKYEGEAPKILNNVEQGSHIIKINLTGYEDWSKIISVDHGQTYRINLTLSPVSNPIASADIEKMWAEYDVMENNLLGMRIHVMFNTHNLKDKNSNISAYFYCAECGERLLDSNQSYCDTDGNIVSYDFFTPTEIDTTFRDFTLFMPYSELHLEISKSPLMTHGDKLKFNVVISREKEIFDVSDWEYFNYTQA